jgi:ATP-binding cassette subfamily B protein
VNRDVRDPRLKPFALLRWAFSPTPRETAWLVLTLLVVWACELATPFLLGRTVDVAVSGKGAARTIVELGTVTTAVLLALYAVHAAYLREEARIIVRASFNLRRHLYMRLLDQPLAWFVREDTGELAHRVVIDCEIVDEHGIALLADVPFAVLTVSGILAVMLWTNASLALLVCATLGASALLSHRMGRPLGHHETARNRRRAVLGGMLQQSFAGMRAIRIFGRESLEVARLDAANRELGDAEIAAGRSFARLEPLLDLITAAGFLAVVWYGAWLVFAGALTPGKLVAFVAYTEILSEPIQGAGHYVRHYVQTKATLGRICELLDGLSWPQPSGARLVDGPLRVELRDVCFSYPGRPVLDGVSFTAEPGEIVAVVGRNGAGKSTLMDILLGLHEADSGAVLIGGVAIEDWDRQALRAATSALSQQVQLLREQRADISGGERQHAALVHVFGLKPRLLVLDEPGTGLSAGAHARLCTMLLSERAGRTTFIVTHDPSLVAIADRVLELDCGRIVWSGPPARFDTLSTGRIAGVKTAGSAPCSSRAESAGTRAVFMRTRC